MSDTDKKFTGAKPKPPPKRGKFPARLHVLFAREAKIGLVIRRGPSKSVCTVLWNRERDTFKLGQWMRGRIYERRCDLSPDSHGGAERSGLPSLTGRIRAREKFLAKDH